MKPADLSPSFGEAKWAVALLCLPDEPKQRADSPSIISGGAATSSGGQPSFPPLVSIFGAEQDMQTQGGDSICLLRTKAEGSPLPFLHLVLFPAKNRQAAASPLFPSATASSGDDEHEVKRRPPSSCAPAQYEQATTPWSPPLPEARRARSTGGPPPAAQQASWFPLRTLLRRQKERGRKAVTLSSSSLYPKAKPLSFIFGEPPRPTFVFSDVRRLLPPPLSFPLRRDEQKRRPTPSFLPSPASGESNLSGALLGGRCEGPGLLASSSRWRWQ